MENNWKKIDGFDHYYINTVGEVYSEKTNRLLTPHLKNGYIFITLRTMVKDDVYTSKNYRVHRLVAKAFIDNPDNKPQVNHINADKRDNRVENLEWCTMEENIQHSKDLKLSRPGGILNKPKEVIRINPLDGTIKEYGSIQLAVKDLFIDEQLSAQKLAGKTKGIRRVLNGLTRSHKGYIFKYKSDVINQEIPKKNKTSNIDKILKFFKVK
jgi:hypothetical protein